MSERKFTPPTEFPAKYVDGNRGKVTILGRSNAPMKPLVGFDEDGYACNYTESGAYYSDCEDTCDLHDIPKRITTWHNVYGTYTHSSYVSRSLADQASIAKRLCVYRIERDEDGRNPEIFVEEV